MTDDITFCGNNCNNTKCSRHPSKTIDKTIPHSFALFADTEMCEKERKKEMNYEEYYNKYKWRSVEDETPPKDKILLCASPRGVLYIGTYDYTDHIKNKVFGRDKNSTLIKQIAKWKYIEGVDDGT